MNVLSLQYYELKVSGSRAESYINVSSLTEFWEGVNQ